MTDYIQSSSELIARKSYQSKSLIKAMRAHTHTHRHNMRGKQAEGGWQAGEEKVAVEHGTHIRSDSGIDSQDH